MDKDNMSILQGIKEAITSACKNTRFSFKDGIDKSKLRCPNKTEQKNWLLDNLRLLLFDGVITTQQYRSIKGEIKNGNFDVVFNFMIKRGVSDIRERFEKYSTSRTIYEHKVKVTFPKPVQMTLVEIKVANKGGV